MHRSHKLTDQSALDMPEGFDPSGIPCLDSAQRRGRPASHRRHERSLPGLAHTSVIAYVESIASRGETKCDDLVPEGLDQVRSQQGPCDWHVWGSVADRPVLFAVPAEVGADMEATIAAGETATAIVEPWQILLEPLD